MVDFSCFRRERKTHLGHRSNHEKVEPSLTMGIRLHDIPHSEHITAGIGQVR